MVECGTDLAYHGDQRPTPDVAVVPSERRVGAWAMDANDDFAPSGAAVQAVFAASDGRVVTLDLIALEAVPRGALTLPTGMPFTVTAEVPAESLAYVTTVLAQWADDGEVLGISVYSEEQTETIVLDGRADQLVLELFHPSTSGGWPV
jgi:hypothetical protein